MRSAKVQEKSEFKVGRFALPHIVFPGPEVCVPWVNPEHRKPCILRSSLQSIFYPGPISLEPLFQRLVLKELNFSGNPHHPPGTLMPSPESESANRYATQVSG